MRRSVLLSGIGAVALASTFALAQDAPESLLPPGFQDPAPTPTATARPTPRPTGETPAPSPTSSPVVQPLPDRASDSTPSGSPAPTPAPAPAASAGDLPDGLPSLRELENMSTDDLDAALGLKPKFDIPPAAQRTLDRIGILSASEKGLAPRALARQPGRLVAATLAGTDGQLVSRWGHIMLRRALASRLAPPSGMTPIRFAAHRAALLNRMGEHAVARALVQDVDTANWDGPLTSAALDAYYATADFVGACPAVRLQGSSREDGEWRLLQAICAAFAGEGARAQQDLNKALRNGVAPQIDVLLAQRYAGAAGQGRRAVNIEWDGVEDLNPWRYGMAAALGIDLPEGLRADAGDSFRTIPATLPMLPIEQRLESAWFAGESGILSSSAMIDLMSQAYAQLDGEGEYALLAGRLREAYVARNAQARLAAIRDVWGGEGRPDYARQVLTAYAAARVTPSEELAESAAPLIASMLTAGLDRDAMAWAPHVDAGSRAWAMLALAQPDRDDAVDNGPIDSFVDADESDRKRQSRFFVAGLAGLDRIDDGTLASFTDRLEFNLSRQSRWTRAISRAAETGNAPLVAFLAGVGMQGESWERMTPLHLYHIVSALNRVGLEGEARMIAAEAVARG